MGCAGSKAKAEAAAKPDPGSVAMRGKPSDAVTTTPAKPAASEEELDAAAEIIQAAALGSPEPAPVASASALQSQKDAERYDPIVAAQLEALKELYKLMDVNNDGQLQASELMTVVSQYTGSVFKENEFFNWYDKHGASSMQGVDGQVSLKEFGWYMADVALTFGEGDEAKSALPTVIKAFKKLASGRTPLLSAIFMELDVTGSGKVDFSAYKKGVKSATMRMFFGSLDQHGKSDGVITMEEWLKIMGQLGDKVKENPDPHHAQSTHLSNALGGHTCHAHTTQAVETLATHIPHTSCLTPRTSHLAPHTAQMTDEQVETDMRAVLAIAKPRAREVLAEKTAARLDELFKGFDSEGGAGAAVPRKALRERMRADAEMLALLGRSGAWALYALKQLGESGPTAKITCTEFKAGLDSYIAARDSAVDGLEQEWRNLDPEATGAVSREKLAAKLQSLMGADSGTSELVAAAGGPDAFSGLQELLDASVEKLRADGPISRAAFLASLKPPRAAATDRLLAVFRTLDTAEKGKLPRAELKAKLAADATVQKLLANAGGAAQFDVLEKLDASSDGLDLGEITLDEFKAGLS